MKLKLALTSVILILSISSARATDTHFPDILSSVSPNAIVEMSNAEATEKKGRYRVCARKERGGYYCSYLRFKSKFPSGWYYGGYVHYKYKFSYRKYGFFGPKRYVSR